MPTLPTNVRQALARRRGFTVIEMMAALAIVSILAALTVDGSLRAGVRGFVG